MGIRHIMQHATADTVTQVSLLDALLGGRFDGCLPCQDLLEHGDLGIGTFDRMDGEMVLVDGTIYQAKADGKVYEPDPGNRSPYATVCHFRPDETWPLSGPVDLENLKKAIDEKAPNQNVFCAVRVDGFFSVLKTQVLRGQTKPYPATAEVVRACAHFEFEDVSGTVVGFRAPPYVRGINDPGYHLHFLSDDRTQGGHVLALTMERGSCAVDICSNHHILLPDAGAALADLDLTRDLVKEFHDALSAAG